MCRKSVRDSAAYPFTVILVCPPLLSTKQDRGTPHLWWSRSIFAPITLGYNHYDFLMSRGKGEALLVSVMGSVGWWVPSLDTCNEWHTWDSSLVVYLWCKVHYPLNGHLSGPR